LDRRTLYSYSRDVLELAETYGSDGRLLFRDEYRLSADGRLRRVTRRQGEDQPDQRLALGEGSRGAAEERYGSQRERRINHFDQTGRLVDREYWDAGELIERETFEYRDEGPLRSVLEELPLERTTVHRYDLEGRVVEEEVIEKGEQIETTRHVRDPRGSIVESITRGPRGLENWRFEYGPEGEPLLEEYRVRGSLERITRYSRQEGERLRVDELYREGELFMRVHYRSEQMVKEEFVRGGEIVRVREYP
jgi:hypothetical protein